MYYAVISDIHSNWSALRAVAARIKEAGVDGVVCCGDVVGYGADPAACVDWVKENCMAVVRGNHDEALVSPASSSVGLAIQGAGRAALIHNRSLLAPHQKEWISALPYTAVVSGTRICHASPGAPTQWTRLSGRRELEAEFGAFAEDVCLVGHTHKPAVYCLSLGVFSLRAGHRYILNPGSVGQPRDGDVRASFGLFDSEKMQWKVERVAYDIQAARQQIRKAGLPIELAERLGLGR